MVRTLDFHSNNVGSIPASLKIIYSIKKFNNIRVQKFHYLSYANLNKLLSLSNHNVVHTLKFSTLYLPSSLKSIRLYSLSSLSSVTSGDIDSKKKILVKQSYIILVWFNYFSYRSNKSTLSVNSSVPSFFVYPKRITKMTTLKSPMAHKTFSQEQSSFEVYNVSISFKTGLTNLSKSTSSINDSLYFLHHFFNKAPLVSTNMLILKKYTITSNFNVSKFFIFNF